MPPGRIALLVWAVLRSKLFHTEKFILWFVTLKNSGNQGSFELAPLNIFPLLTPGKTNEQEKPNQNPERKCFPE